MSKFFEAFQRDSREQLGNSLEDANSEKISINEYPNWVLTSKKPEFYKAIYDYIIKLKAEKKCQIDSEPDVDEKTCIITQKEVASYFGKQKSFFRNHEQFRDMIKDDINPKLLRQFKLRKTLPKKTSNKVKLSREKSEKEHYKKQYEDLLATSLQKLLNSELVTSQKDALKQIADLKIELAEKSQHIAKLEDANSNLQQEIYQLQKKFFCTSS